MQALISYYLQALSKKKSVATEMSDSNFKFKKILNEG